MLVAERHVDILINNAGIMAYKRQLTEDGIEMNLGVNHIGINSSAFLCVC